MITTTAHKAVLGPIADQLPSLRPHFSESVCSLDPAARPLDAPAEAWGEEVVEVGQRTFGSLGTVLVIIPTYDEADNIEWIVSRVRASVPEAHILVADDNSPDGTGKIVDQIADGDAHVHALHRQGKEGLGAAYLAGFRWGIDHGYGVLVEMDTDGSHQPEQLPQLLGGPAGRGSRPRVALGCGGSVVNWPKSRELLPRGGSLYSRLLLGVPIRDATGGFRAFRRETLEGLGMENVTPRATASRSIWPGVR